MKTNIHKTVLIAILFFLLKYHGDNGPTILHTPLLHIDFLQIVVLVIITRLIWWR